MYSTITISQIVNGIIASRENMITDRTTEEDNPVRKANAHKKRITRKNPKGLKAAHRFHKKEKKNKNKVESKPI